jgi:hypothetical protein
VAIGALVVRHRVQSDAMLQLRHRERRQRDECTFRLEKKLTLEYLRQSS